MIGGGYQGKGKLPWAEKVFMDESSQIRASAVDEGDGGLVVLWSKERTLFDGTILAQGGAFSGHGGLVETSSKKDLNILKGNVDTAAPRGQFGTWLLDPNEVYIVKSAVS